MKCYVDSSHQISLGTSCMKNGINLMKTKYFAMLRW